MKTKTVLTILLLVSLVLFVVPVAAEGMPQLPMQIYGTATTTVGGDLPAGSIITAKLNGQTFTYTLTEAGKIGEAGSYGTKFNVSSSKTSGTVVFKYNGKEAEDTVEYVPGNLVQVALAFDNFVPVTAITVSGANTVSVGRTVTLTATVVPDNASYQTVVWSSSDSSIATVDSTGTVKGEKAGTVTITATATDGTAVSGSLQMEVKVLDTLVLREGWNFISVPMKLDSSMETASQFFSEVDMGGNSVLGYDSSSKSWIQLTASTVLKPLDAYWVYSNTDFIGTKKIKFDTKSVTIGNTKDIYKGWNAVGLNIDVTDGTDYLSAKSTFAGLNWNRYFENYTTGTWKVIVNGGSPSEDESHYVYAGAGGWLYANEDGILVGNSS